MYERAFDTDWESLSGEEATRRMYALGIDAELGTHHPEERRRIVELAANAYERSVLELAFEEGRREIADVRPRHDSDEDAWSELVESSAAPSSLPVAPDEPNTPGAVDRPGLLDGFDADDLGQIRLPPLLKRNDE